MAAAEMVVGLGEVAMVAAKKVVALVEAMEAARVEDQGVAEKAEANQVVATAVAMEAAKVEDLGVVSKVAVLKVAAAPGVVPEEEAVWVVAMVVAMEGESEEMGSTEAEVQAREEMMGAAVVAEALVEAEKGAEVMARDLEVTVEAGKVTVR